MGPWGGNGGTSWDDGAFTGVREVTLVYDRCIDSIRVVYDKNGKPFTTEKHGGVGGNKTAEVSSIMLYIVSFCFLKFHTQIVIVLFVCTRLSCNSQMNS